MQYISTDYGSTQYIFNEPISHNQSAKFKIKVTQGRLIKIGIVDYAKQKDQRYSYDSSNAICYSGYGKKYP